VGEQRTVGGKRGFGSGAPSAEIFTVFFSKLHIFKHILVEISASNAFLNDCKKCADAPRGTCPYLLRHWLTRQSYISNRE